MFIVQFERVELFCFFYSLFNDSAHFNQQYSYFRFRSYTVLQFPVHISNGKRWTHKNVKGLMFVSCTPHEREKAKLYRFGYWKWRWDWIPMHRVSYIIIWCPIKCCILSYFGMFLKICGVFYVRETEMFIICFFFFNLFDFFKNSFRITVQL